MILDDALFGLTDDTARNPRRSGAGSSAGDGVNDNRRAPIAKNGMLVSTKRDVWRNYYRVTGSVGRHNQREIRNVSSRQTCMFAVA